MGLCETSTVVFMPGKVLPDDDLNRYIGVGVGRHCAGQHYLKLDVRGRKAAVDLNRAAAATGWDALVFCSRAKGLAAACV
jgi:hypothetical protein